MDGVSKSKVAKVSHGDQFVLYEFVRLGQYSGHIRYVEVADIGPKKRIDLCAKGVAFPVKPPGVHRIIRFATEVKIVNKEISQILFALDFTRSVVIEIVDTASGSGFSRSGRGAPVL